MRQQLSDLVVVQELDALDEAVSTAGMREQEERLGFRLSEANRLRAERARIAASLSAELLERYERLRQRYRRAVVPTLRGVCLGCFTLRPTAMAARAGGLEICERCGRILFRVEAAAAASTLGHAASIHARPVRRRASRKESAPQRSSPRSRRGRR